MPSDSKDKVIKTDAEWRKQLDAHTYEITRKKGTEPAHSGKYAYTKEKGVYHCTCCGAPLFESDTKYESGTGWPSFYKPISDDAVATEEDFTHGMIRTEALCAKCDAHLGHVFPDGPQPTGLRYCMNSASLKLEPKEE